MEEEEASARFLPSSGFQRRLYKSGGKVARLPVIVPERLRETIVGAGSAFVGTRERQPRWLVG